MDGSACSTNTEAPSLGDVIGSRRGVTTRLSAYLRQRLPDDPGMTSLRRATRAAIVIPTTFAFAKFITGDVQVTTFAAFGGFALLVMADFGGARPPRAAAYVITTIIGGMLVSFGTLV